MCALQILTVCEGRTIQLSLMTWWRNGEGRLFLFGLEWLRRYWFYFHQLWRRQTHLGEMGNFLWHVTKASCVSGGLWPKEQRTIRKDRIKLRISRCVSLAYVSTECCENTVCVLFSVLRTGRLSTSVLPLAAKDALHWFEVYEIVCCSSDAFISVEMPISSRSFKHYFFLIFSSIY